MKVILRNPHAADGRDFSHSLTVGGEYEVLGIEGNFFRLLDNFGEPVLYDPENFDVVDPTEPPCWLSALGEDGERYAYPPGWSRTGFFEAWHDRNVPIRRVFAAQLRFWYPTVTQRPKTEGASG